MQYSDVRCTTCATWRTALVGYSGDQICLTCGGTVGQPDSGTGPSPFSLGSWTNASWSQAAEPTREQRMERLRRWLGANLSVTLSEDIVEILALCDSAGEVRFALPIVTLSTWVPVSERSFSDGVWTLRVQQPVLGEPAAFVLEGRGGMRPVVIEVERPDAASPEQRRRDHIRTLHLMAGGYGVMRIAADRAGERGAGFRRAFMRTGEAVQIVERTLEPPSPAAVEKPRRMWARHELVYDATELAPGERRELVEDWLRSRREVLERWQLDFLAHCDRAAEIHFALPFLRLPDAEPLDDRTVHLGPWHTLRAKAPVDGYPVDFLFSTLLPERSELISVLVEIYPPRGPRDQRAELERLRRWRAAGHQVIDLAAIDARAHGERWAQSLRREYERRESQQAG